MRKQLPVVTPLKLRDFQHALFHGRNGNVDFCRAFSQRLGVKHCHLVSSGRAALCLALMALRSFSERIEVVIPAYTCPTVPLSVARAGLQVRLCDVDLRTFNLDLHMLEGVVDDKTLAVVLTPFYGFPYDMRRVTQICQHHDVRVVEDAAQAMGAKFDGKPIGSFGDISTFSLDRGKCITALNGGVIATNRAAYAESIAEQLNRAPTLNVANQLVTFTKLLAVFSLSYPRPWWAISKLPLGFEPQVHPIDFPIAQFPSWQAAFGRSVLDRLDALNRIRIKHGEHLMKELGKRDGISVPQVVPGAEPMYLRFPVLIEDAERRNRIYSKLHARGVSASKMYFQSLNRYEYLRQIVPQGSYPNAEYMAARILMLPTHPQMTGKDFDTILGVFDMMT